MGLLLDAAQQWDRMQNVSYKIVIGRKHTSNTINLIFRTMDFDHLSGIHYIEDVDFGMHRREYRGKNFLPSVLSGKLDDTLVEKSGKWNKISERLFLITEIEEILDSDFSVYKFSPKKLSFHSKIEATYLFFSPIHEKAVFVFVDSDNDCFYCKSLFPQDTKDYDYRTNQSPWAVLKKVKKIGDMETELFIRPTYRKTEEDLQTRGA